MDPIRIYDYLVLARARLLDWTRPLGAEAYERSFAIGLGSLARTLTHIMICEWYYIERIAGRDTPPYAQWPIQDEKPPALAVLEAAWTEQVGRTREALRGVRDWGATIEYAATEHDGRKIIVTASAADIFTQLAMHEVHHRAQAMNMLRQLGVAAADLDFNEFMYRRRDA